MVGAGQAVRAGWEPHESREMEACDGGQWGQVKPYCTTLHCGGFWWHDDACMP
jgi:hypothetical protein